MGTQRPREPKRMSDMTRMTWRPLFVVLLLAGAVAGMRGTMAQPADAPKPGEVFRDCNDCAEMVVVPVGDFEMGGGDLPFEKPQHKVTLAHPVAIGRSEITFDEWDLCYSAGGCKHRPDDHGWGRGKRPVIDVSWGGAKAYLAWMSRTPGKNYRLPTEAEWEYAARAGTATPFWRGRDVGKGNANCEGCAGGPTARTMPSRSFRPNAFGLYDTSGNAAEWVEDC